ncbi:MAG: HEAT repeat domain-containing protein [Opitutaceae bacterium]|nr:HEAT repeat domain-containing protein [Opitutaceae bacterium]
MKTPPTVRLLRWLVALGLATNLSASPVDVDALVRVLRDPSQDANAKGEACLQLMDLGPAAAPAVSALVGLLAAPEEILRDYAVTTLERIGPPARNALPALRRVAAQDSSPEIRGLARAAIARIGGAAPEPETTKPVAAAPREAAPAKPAVIAPRPVATATRPPLVVHEGRYFRWAAPAGWTESESTNGVTLTAPDGLTSVSSALLLRSPGMTTPADFAVWMLDMVPENGALQVLGKRDLPDQPSGFGTPWKVQELEMLYTVNGRPVRAIWTCGIVAVSGVFDAFVLGYQAPPPEFATAKLWLAPVARSVTITNPGEVAGNNTLLTPKNHPLDNTALLESWRQKGLSEDRIAKAQREETMGYERMKDPETGRIYEMPLERWDGTIGGYRNPQRPEEILQPTTPAE